MVCRIVALDKYQWVCPVGIGETLRRALTKLFFRTAGDQAKSACRSLKLCTGLEPVIEGITQSVRRRREERVSE